MCLEIGILSPDFAIRFIDPLGLEVLLCKRPINVDFVPSGVSSSEAFPWHHWLKTDKNEAGMGGQCAVPGQGCADVPYVTQTKIKDHTGQSDEPNSQCEVVDDVDEECVDKILESGDSTGTWTFINQCQTVAREIISQCSTRKRCSGQSCRNWNDRELPWRKYSN